MTQRSRAGSFTGVAAGGRLMMLNRDAYTWVLLLGFWGLVARFPAPKS
ncbi:MAG: hypothetical protein WB682_06450 [Candidatus Dormiibacterota bacterium]